MFTKLLGEWRHGKKHGNSQGEDMEELTFIKWFLGNVLGIGNYIIGMESVAVTLTHFHKILHKHKPFMDFLFLATDFLTTTTFTFAKELKLPVPVIHLQLSSQSCAFYT